MVLVGRHRQDLDGHQVAHLDVLGLEDDGHAAGADAVEDAVVTQDQPEGGARADARRLVVGEQSGLDQQRQRAREPGERA